MRQIAERLEGEAAVNADDAATAKRGSVPSCACRRRAATNKGNVQLYGLKAPCRRRSGAEVEDDAGFDIALLDFLEAVIDFLEPPGLPDHPGAALRMDCVHLGEVLACPHD